MKDKFLPFSVSMCVYKNDNPIHFNLAINSIIDQSIKPSEVVLVVDGPITEELDKIINSYVHYDFFKIIRLKKNQGHGNARRIGMKNCSNDLIALMDADDISLHHRFEKQLKVFMKNSEISVVGGNITEFVDNIKNIVSVRKLPQNDYEIKKFMKYRCPFNQMTVMFKSSDVLEAGGYLDWYCNEDYFLWIRMAKKNKIFKNIDDTLVYVRVGQEMYARRGGWKYFLSEVKLQQFMFREKINNFSTYFFNIIVRFLVQILMNNKLRKYFYNIFAR
jgi:glycosyltransferase involved in cell wall biosynthesis